MTITRNDGVDIYWRENGSGEPLLMIMGLGYTSEMWHDIEAALLRQQQVENGQPQAS